MIQELQPIETPMTDVPPSKHIQPLEEPTGVRLIVAYKFIKAAVEAGAALLLIVLRALGLLNELHNFALTLHDHAASVWSITVAKYLASATTPHHLGVITIALSLDAIFSLTEGWALYKHYWWGSWLVIVATSALVPLEVRELMHRITFGRCVLLVLNLAIVFYLLRIKARHTERKIHT